MRLVLQHDGRVERGRAAPGGDHRYGAVLDPAGVCFDLWTENPAR